MLDFDSVLVFVISLSAAKCILVGVATVEIGASRSAHRFVVLFFHVQRGGNRATDLKDQIAPLNFLPLRQIAGDHADHLSCWVCVLSRPFLVVQTMLEVNPSAEMERRRCSHRICKVRPFCKILTYGCRAAFTAV